MGDRIVGSFRLGVVVHLPIGQHLFPVWPHTTSRRHAVRGCVDDVSEDGFAHGFRSRNTSCGIGIDIQTKVVGRAPVRGRAVTKQTMVGKEGANIRLVRRMGRHRGNVGNAIRAPECTQDRQRRANPPHVRQILATESTRCKSKEISQRTLYQYCISDAIGAQQHHRFAVRACKPNGPRWLNATFQHDSVVRHLPETSNRSSPQKGKNKLKSAASQTH